MPLLFCVPFVEIDRSLPLNAEFDRPSSLQDGGNSLRFLAGAPSSDWRIGRLLAGRLGSAIADFDKGFAAEDEAGASAFMDASACFISSRRLLAVAILSSFDGSGFFVCCVGSHSIRSAEEEAEESVAFDQSRCSFPRPDWDLDIDEAVRRVRL